MKYTINYSGRFKKSYKLCKRRGLNIANFETVVSLFRCLLNTASRSPTRLSVFFRLCMFCELT